MTGAAAAARDPLARGLAEHRAGRLDPAEGWYRDALTVDPDNARALHLLGLLRLQQGDAQAAMPLLRRAAGRDPADADCRNRLGAAYAALGNRIEAARAYRGALALDPDHAEAHSNLGMLLAESGDVDAAVEEYRRAIAAAPDFAEAHNNLAVALAGIGRVEDAERHFRTALGLRPGYADARANLGDLMLRLGDLARAKAELRAAIDIAPDHLQARLLMADALMRQGALEAALDEAQIALSVAPESARAHNCYGMICQQSGGLHRGLAHLDHALALDPGLADAHGNRAIALTALGRLDEAEGAARRAVELAPEFAVHHLNLALILLLRGKLEEGFAEYRWRFRTGLPWLEPRRFDQAAWHGEPLDGKAVLAWGEQGVGEEIMFASLLPRLADAARRVVVECDPRLVPLFRRSFADLSVVARATLAAPAARDAEIEVQLAAGDLPAALRFGAGDDPAPAAYLVADPGQLAAAKRRLADLGPGLKVGIAWRSVGANMPFSRSKSSSLACWQAVLRTAGAVFVNLQHGDCARELAQARDRFGVQIHDDPSVDQRADLDAFAAQVAALDLVVTTSNTTAHMAGALGQEVWVVLPHVADWRWQHRRSDSLWYPRASLIRQPQPGDWAGALAEVARRLGARAGGAS